MTPSNHQGGRPGERTALCPGRGPRRLLARERLAGILPPDGRRRFRLRLTASPLSPAEHCGRSRSGEPEPHFQHITNDRFWRISVIRSLREERLLRRNSDIPYVV